MKENNPHGFLAEELLVPNFDKTDAGRVTMFCNHISQCLVLDNGETPKVFTRFENQIGEVSTAYRKYDEDIIVRKVFWRNENSGIAVIQFTSDGVYDVIEIDSTFHITENYGGQNNIDFYRNITENNVNEQPVKVEAGTMMNYSNAYDEDGTFNYGLNLKTVFYSTRGQTYEDGVVISESAAKKLAHTYVKKIQITVNNNDILLNLYGDDENYQCLPKIGEEVKDGILTARRRIVNDTALFTLTNEKLKDYNSNDNIFYGKQKVEDIFVYSNANLEELSHDNYNSQIYSILVRQKEYFESVYEYLNSIKETVSYTEDFSYHLKRAEDYIEGKKKWFAENDFDNVIIEVKLTEQKTAQIGSKLTGRYGNKGVISGLIPDEEMPMTEDGEHAEICLNSLGVINRLNPSVLYEHELNAIAHQVEKQLRFLLHEDRVTEALDLYLEFIEDVSPTQSEAIVSYFEELEVTDEDIIYNYLVSVVEEGFRIYQAPFTDNISLERLESLYDKYDAGPVKFKGIEEPLIFGDLYFLKLIFSFLSTVM